MSWRVESLLQRRAYIREEHDIFSDDFNNILIIENEIDRMSVAGEFKDREKRIISAVYSGQPFHELEKEVGVSKETIAKIFKEICEKIATNLGGEFTDEGYVAYLKDCYHLSEADEEKLKKYIKSKFRHRINRRPIK